MNLFKAHLAAITRSRKMVKLHSKSLSNSGSGSGTRLTTSWNRGVKMTNVGVDAQVAKYLDQLNRGFFTVGQ